MDKSTTIDEDVKETLKVMEIRKIGREFPIEPDKTDKEAFEYIKSIKFAIEELREELDGKYNEDDDYDILREFAEGTVPIFDYIAANAYAQLGIYRRYFDDEFGQYDGEDRYFYSVRLGLFVMAEEILMKYIKI